MKYHLESMTKVPSKIKGEIHHRLDDVYEGDSGIALLKEILDRMKYAGKFQVTIEDD